MRLINKFLIPLIALVMLLCASNIQWNKSQWRSIIESDGKGYYAYLPAVFIYHDLQFQFFDGIERTYYSPNTYYDYRAGSQGRTVNKYFAGTAVAMMPFFALAHGYSAVFVLPTDGYNKPYPLMISVAAIFYLCFGLFYLRKLMQSYRVGDTLSAFTLLILVFGTNLFYYTLGEPAMSHVYSFAFVCMWLYYTRKALLTSIKKYHLYAAALLGLIVLIRPVNGIIILAIPFLAGSKEHFISALRFILKKPGLLLLCFILVLVFPFSQLLIYKVQTGSFFIDSYSGEGFNWLHPQVYNILFSYRKGLFVYTPVLFLTLLGFVYLFKYRKWEAWSLFIFLAVLTYVLSCWWNWYYGGSFSSRVYVEYLPFFALLLVFAFQLLSAKKTLKMLYASSIVLLVGLCQLQTYQYRYYLIHWENMNKEKYWQVFMKVKP